ncbi:putative ribosome assembly protein 3 [Calycina marina]|uniref:Ribosome assembly protein 3 n=1 Tax=Calycina marina TaxID=1763456 RepID=A0A9P8CEP5_9HELO|nr:putative ribosome assembly protein 3 [Calycina marina]
MDARNATKQKRRKKSKPRTQASSDSDSEHPQPTQKSLPKSDSPKALTSAEVSAAFTKYYLQHATQEFAENLDKVRAAEDFRDDALPLLVNALQQGTSLFTAEEQRRIVEAGMEKKKK